MRLIPITHERASEAAETLARAMAGEPSGRWLLPDPDESLAVHEEIFGALIRLALNEGHVDAWGDPLVGVAVWLRRPALTSGRPSSSPRRTAAQLPVTFPEHAAERVERYMEVIGELRRRARADEHAYLDSMAVLPEYRRRGIAGELLDAGHAWADAAGLPCSLDTETAQNVAFYGRRGYEIRAELPLPGSGLRITAMRRPRPE